MTDYDTYRVPTPNGRSAVTGRFNPPPSAGDTTPISDEAVEAYRRAASTGRTAGLLGKEYTRRGLAAARPLLVPAEAERRDEFPEHLIAQRDEAQAHLAEAEREVEGMRGEMDSERTARARDLVRYSQDAMFLRLNAAETQRDVALDLVEGLRAELAAAHDNAADEIRREARWQESLRVRGNSGPSWQQSIDRLLAVEQIVRSRAAVLRAAGGQEKPVCPLTEAGIEHRPHHYLTPVPWDCPGLPAAPVGGQAEPSTQVQTLAAAVAEAQENARAGHAEGRDEDYTRFWHAAAGWLKARIKAIERGEEPHWPDAARVGGQPEPSDAQKLRLDLAAIQDLTWADRPYDWRLEQIQQIAAEGLSRSPLLAVSGEHRNQDGKTHQGPPENCRECAYEDGAYL